MKIEEAKKLASECIKASTEAWCENFGNSKDVNGVSVGMIANTLLQHCLGDEKIELPN